MKRYLCMLMTVVLLLSCMLIGTPKTYAATKVEETRAISIVFDNSGSMYKNGNQAWCRATYATEVFASMLNKGDVLHIYPMNPIIIEGKEYSMQNPFVITDASQASLIRGILTKGRGDTHIESIDCAINGLKNIKADKKYMLVLSDGDVFYRNKKQLSVAESKKQLDAYFKQASKEIPMMYLSIGAQAIVPDTPESGVFVKRQAKNSEDVLSALMEMCNLIFGRDMLPDNRIQGKTVNFDVSMKKLIVFVQGENIADLKLKDSKGNLVGTASASQQVKHSTKGSDVYPNNADTSLQGMMVTYTGCAAGTYNLEHTGTATSVEVYYEPDADLAFVFTDANGNAVDPNALYEGEYMVSFGMRDARTGKLIESDLLGKTRYEGHYYINGTVTEIASDKNSGSVKIPLKMGDTFKADLTVTYLSGYTISKDSSDFGWPEGGIQVAPRPAEDFKLEISGGDSSYSIQTLEEGAPYTVKVFYKDTQLTGEELKKVELKWNPETSNVELRKEFAEDHWKIYLLHKNPEAPQETVCGECTVQIMATYSAPGSEETQTQSPLTYRIEEDISQIQIDLSAPETYLVIRELEESQPIVVTLKLNGAPLTPADFAALQLAVDTGGIEYTATPCEEDSTYLIKLLPTDGIQEGDYTIKVTARYKDLINRETQADDSLLITLSSIPIWLKWLIVLLVLLLLIILIIMIMHIRVLPSRVRRDLDGCSLHVGGKEVTEDANFFAKLMGKQLSVYVEYNAEEIGRVSINNLVPGKESYLYKPSQKRSILVKFPESVSVSGDVTAVDIAGVGYAMNKDEKLVPEDEQQGPYNISNLGIVTMSGKTLVAGKEKKFNAEIPLNFKK